MTKSRQIAKLSRNKAPFVGFDRANCNTLGGEDILTTNFPPATAGAAPGGWHVGPVTGKPAGEMAGEGLGAIVGVPRIDAGI